MASTKRTLSVIVASRNPVKINSALVAVRGVFSSLDVEAVGVDAASGVSEQPMGDGETLQGARNRARWCDTNGFSDRVIVAVEGGVSRHENELECFAWAVVKYGKAESKARSASFALPPSLSKLVADGMELGPANDLVFKEHNSKQKGGVIGRLTNDYIDRQEYYQHTITMALIPFLHPDLYPGFESPLSTM